MRRDDEKETTTVEALREAIRKGLDRGVCKSAEEVLTRLETDLEATLHRVKAYRAADPDFEHAIARFAEAEAAHAIEDPVEG